MAASSASARIRQLLPAARAQCGQPATWEVRELLAGARPEVPLLVLPIYTKAERIKEAEAELAPLSG